jgi:hypothetical protein
VIKKKIRNPISGTLPHPIPPHPLSTQFVYPLLIVKNVCKGWIYIEVRNGHYMEEYILRMV